MVPDQRSDAMPSLTVVLCHVPGVVRRQIPRPHLELEGTAGRVRITASVAVLRPRLFPPAPAADGAVAVAPTNGAVGVHPSGDSVLGLRQVFGQPDVSDVNCTVTPRSLEADREVIGPEWGNEPGEVGPESIDPVLVPIASQGSDPNRGALLSPKRITGEP